MISPIFQAFPFTEWRKHLRRTWNFLQLHCVVKGNASCATHVHVSIYPSYKLGDIRRLAQAAIHFEPALEALVPEHCRVNEYAKNNWLDGAGLGQAEKSRRESIAAIGRASTLKELVMLMQGDGTLIDRNYSWNFSSLTSKKGTIEFRKAPVSLGADDALCWAELAMSFVHASLGCKSTKALEKVPATVGGLRWFLQQFEIPTMHEPAHLQTLWAGRDPGGAMQPRAKLKFRPTQDEKAKERRIKQMAAADLEQILAFAKTAREPYWP
jgi:Putative amidoligase enzyme